MATNVPMVAAAAAVAASIHEGNGEAEDDEPFADGDGSSLADGPAGESRAVKPVGQVSCRPS